VAVGAVVGEADGIAVDVALAAGEGVAVASGVFVEVGRSVGVAVLGTVVGVGVAPVLIGPM